MAAAQGAGSGSAGPSGPPGPAPGHSSGSTAVAVWEWQDEFGRWRPYRGNVCSYIEQVIQASQQKGRRSGSGLVSSIPLGHADPALAPYVIDIPSLTQFRQDTGKGGFPTRPAGVLGDKQGLVLCVRALQSPAVCYRAGQLCEHICCSPDAVCCPVWKILWNWVQADRRDLFRSIILEPLELPACEPELSELETSPLPCPPAQSIQDHLRKKGLFTIPTLLLESLAPSGAGVPAALPWHAALLKLLVSACGPRTTPKRCSRIFPPLVLCQPGLLLPREKGWAQLQNSALIFILLSPGVTGSSSSGSAEMTPALFCSRCAEQVELRQGARMECMHFIPGKSREIPNYTPRMNGCFGKFSIHQFPLCQCLSRMQLSIIPSFRDRHVLVSCQLKQ